jgi:hypothetical protein
MEYGRLAFRMVFPRKERSIAGEVTAITGAGSGRVRRPRPVLKTLSS